MAIRLGIIGLSADPGAWASMAHLAPLKSDKLSKQYAITALATSSPESAKASAKVHGVAEGKAYSQPEDIAKDPDVDMVVVSVKLPLHKQLVMPALQAKKNVFVEWPLGVDLKQAEEIAAYAKKQGVKTVVGLQQRLGTAVLKAKDIIESGSLGRCTCTSIMVSTSALENLPARGFYLNDPKIGANMISISMAHILDPLCSLFGEFKSLNATSTTMYPEWRLVNPDGSKSEPIKKTLADSVTVQGILGKGVNASFSFNCTTAGTPDQYLWIISGEKGSLKLAADSLWLAPKLYQYTPGEGATWEEVVTRDTYFGGVGELYVAYADGGKAKPVDFEGAVVRHKMVEAIYRSAEKGTRESY